MIKSSPFLLLSLSLLHCLFLICLSALQSMSTQTLTPAPPLPLTVTHKVEQCVCARGGSYWGSRGGGSYQSQQMQMVFH